MIDAAYNNSAKKLLFLGSSCIYPKYAEQPIKEEVLLTGELEPTNQPYAVAKIAGKVKVNSTNGITRLVSFGKEPTAVPLDLVSQLMLRCDAQGKLLPPKVLKPGDQVKLTKGPFANFVAEVEKIAPDRRVWVLMDIMGGQTRVAVGAEQLRAS